MKGYFLKFHGTKYFLLTNRLYETNDSIWKIILEKHNMSSNIKNIHHLSSLSHKGTLTVNGNHYSISVSGREYNGHITDKDFVLYRLNCNAQNILTFLEYEELDITDQIAIWSNELICKHFLNDATIYSSLKELGEDTTDNGCREESDTDESFDEFLCTTEHYFKLPSGKVLAI